MSKQRDLSSSHIQLAILLTPFPLLMRSMASCLGLGIFRLVQGTPRRKVQAVTVPRRKTEIPVLEVPGFVALLSILAFQANHGTGGPNGLALT